MRGAQKAGKKAQNDILGRVGKFIDSYVFEVVFVALINITAKAKGF